MIIWYRYIYIYDHMVVYGLTSGRVVIFKYMQRNLFDNLLNQTEIRLYLLFSSIYLEQQTDTHRLLFQINRKMVTTI